jgi:hypothetical protein
MASFSNAWASEVSSLRSRISGLKDRVTKMSWLGESVKKRACRYFLQHYLGQYFKHKIEVEQLSVDMYKGEGTISDLQLDVEVSIYGCLASHH